MGTTAAAAVGKGAAAAVDTAAAAEAAAVEMPYVGVVVVKTRGFVLAVVHVTRWATRRVSSVVLLLRRATLRQVRCVNVYIFFWLG